MTLYAFLLLSVISQHTLTMPTSTVGDIAGAGEEEERYPDITEINKDLDLHEGDIMLPSGGARNTILGDQYRWGIPVPYVLDESLDMNAKGIILRAMEQIRLKTCVDFKPREAEPNYLFIIEDEGCYSYVGNQRWGNQSLSIGLGCGHIAIIEHEFLHALGFWHEQSRYDRDDHVTIVWENIEEGKEHNFEKRSASQTSTLGTPFDYTSVMHYGKEDFTNGNGSTIITKQPEYQDVIGQRLDMSSNDVLKLNTLYNCTSAVTFLETCSFEDIQECGMILSASGNASWERVGSVQEGPNSDHTKLGPLWDTDPVSVDNSTTFQNETAPTSATNMSTTDSDGGFFMHYSTATGKEGDGAKMESVRKTPRRQFQCLQLFYYHSGGDQDLLNIWIREYDDNNPKGTPRLMGQITGPPASYWQLHHVSLNATKTFQVEFEVRKGAGPSTGGVSIDDINLSETECPHHTWQIRDFENVAKNTDTWLFSPRHYSRDGYAYQLMVVLRSSYIGVYARLLSGKYDDQLQWPCPWRQITFLLMDQNPNIQLRMSKQNSISTDPEQIDYKNGEKYLFWDIPRKNGTFYKQEGNDSIYATKGWGYGYFMSFKDIKDKGFLKGGDIFFLTSMQDISSLQCAGNNLLPCPTPPPQDFTPLPSKQEEGPYSASLFDFSSGLVSTPAIIVMALMLWLIH
ncbi:meprin A subunit beta isoform X1 [Salmo salar]|uniref:Metalloendopeptidase n=1 Tax=Salmo salar TaxID=8030 RepID=A0A1S3RXU2_SALSA|nr:meprin A subunit beta isoform X1 [Salmo salar]